MAWHDPDPGQIYHWNPVGGSDANNGIPVALGGTGPKLTWAGGSGIEDTWQAGDTCYVVMPGRTTELIVTETVILSKAQVSLIGPRNGMLRLQPTGLAAGIALTGLGATVANLIADSSNTGSSQHAVRIEADHCQVHNVWAADSRNAGIKFGGASHCVASKCLITGSTNAGALLNSTSLYNVIDGCIFYDNGSEGVSVAASQTHNTLVRSVIAGNTAEGVEHNDASALAVIDCAIFDNGGGDFQAGFPLPDQFLGGAGTLTRDQRKEIETMIDDLAGRR